MDIGTSNFSFTEFWGRVQKCRQLNNNRNGGFFTIDAAAVFFAILANEKPYKGLDDALDWLSISENPNTAIWSEPPNWALAADANEQGFASTLEYIRVLPEAYRLGSERWLVRCE